MKFIVYRFSLNYYFFFITPSLSVIDHHVIYSYINCWWIFVFLILNHKNKFCSIGLNLYRKHSQQKTQQKREKKKKLAQFVSVNYVAVIFVFISPIFICMYVHCSHSHIIRIAEIINFIKP